MAQLYVFRSQAVEAMQRAGHKNFRTELDSMGSGMWKGWYEPGESPAEGWQDAKDYVHHVETTWYKPPFGDKPTAVGVLVITCRKDEIPAEDVDLIDRASFAVEPLTPSLWEEDKPEASKPERAPRSSSTGERASSTAQSPTKLVWEIADSMPGASRKDIIAACVEKGVHPSTASTQYSKWNRAKNA